jgi:undecaprenyl-diphosphatase
LLRSARSAFPREPVLGAHAMTASGGAHRRPSPSAGAVAARLAMIVENIGGGLAILVRRPRPTSAALTPAWRRFALHGLLTVGAVALSMAFLDQPVHELATGLPQWLIDVFDAVTDFGRSGWILVPVGTLIALIALLDSPTLDRMSRVVLAMAVTRLGYVFLAVGVPGLTVTIIKRLIGRVRPSAQGPFAYEPFSWRPDYASFPSGHSTTAFAALVALGLLFPRARPLLWVYALLVAASRIIVDAHYSSDVIAGAAFGAFGAVWVRDWLALRQLGFVVGPGGVVHAKSGPSLRRYVNPNAISPTVPSPRLTRVRRRAEGEGDADRTIHRDSAATDL